jgi:hypothetical protein
MLDEPVPLSGLDKLRPNVEDVPANVVDGATVEKVDCESLGTFLPLIASGS